MPEALPIPTTGYEKWTFRWIVAGFTRSWAWRAAGAALGIALGPDAVNLALQFLFYLLDNRDAALAIFPTLSWEWKAAIGLIGNFAVLVLRPIKQGNMPEATTPVAVFNVPRTVDLVTSSGVSVAVPTQIRERPEPSTGAQYPTSPEAISAAHARSMSELSQP